jgi:hypothetical protein
VKAAGRTGKHEGDEGDETEGILLQKPFMVFIPFMSSGGNFRMTRL